MKNINEIARLISDLNSTEINQLSEALLDYNISATIYNFEIVGDVEKFEVYLADSGKGKLAVVRLLKETFGLGLKDAKYYVDNSPCLLARDLTYDNAKKIKTDFEEIGATITIFNNKS